MLKTLQIKLNYKPTEWGVKIEGENIKAFVLWTCLNKDLCIFGDDWDCIGQCVNDFTESADFDELKKAYKWIDGRVNE